MLVRSVDFVSESLVEKAVEECSERVDVAYCLGEGATWFRGMVTAKSIEVLRMLEIPSLEELGLTIDDMCSIAMLNLCSQGCYQPDMNYHGRTDADFTKGLEVYIAGTVRYACLVTIRDLGNITRKSVSVTELEEKGDSWESKYSREDEYSALFSSDGSDDYDGLVRDIRDGVLVTVDGRVVDGTVALCFLFLFFGYVSGNADIIRYLEKRSRWLLSFFDVFIPDVRNGMDMNFVQGLFELISSNAGSGVDAVVPLFLRCVRKYDSEVILQWVASVDVFIFKEV